MNLESMLHVGRMVGLLEEAVMPSPYSADLRERVLLADAAGLSPAVVAARFGVGLSTVYLWRQQARAEGRRCAKPHGGGRARGIDPAGEAILWGLVAERNDRTLDEYRELLAAGGGPQVSRPTLCRTLRRLGLRRKKRRCAPASGIGPISRRSARSSASGYGSSTPRTWFLLTRPASPQR